MSDTRSSDVSNDSCRPPRTIVVCFDGTNGQYDSKNTNVVKFFRLLCKDCPEKQVAYYQPGIGTYFAPGVVSPLFSRLASLLDGAVAWYLDAHVMGGYKFLMDNYHAGDRICLFGFSRGAYTARALAGMLDKVGLLHKDNLQQVNFAYKAYTRTDKEGVRLAAGFKETFSQNVKIDFLGVWDTVQSTGVLVSRALPFTDSNVAIRVFRHALSLDERRARFRPNLYRWLAPASDPNEAAKLGNVAAGKFAVIKSALERMFRRKDQTDQLHKEVHYGTFTQDTRRSELDIETASGSKQPKANSVAEASSPTDVLEVWFSGCHSDIGGGNVQDDVNVSLAQITLHWMVEHVVQSQCGIVFDNNELARIGFTTSPLSARPPTTGANCSAAEELPDKPDQPALGQDTSPYTEHSDAIAPLYDQLKIHKLWWILEILPVSNAWQDADGVWQSSWSINLGRGRYIPHQKPKFHHTVKERMEHKLLNYKPNATYDNNAVYI